MTQQQTGQPGADAFRGILWARGVRDFGDRLLAVVLPAYLLALGHGTAEIGAIATIALLGSALMTLGAGMLGARVDARTLQVRAAALMAATGLGLPGLDALRSMFALYALLGIGCLLAYRSMPARAAGTARVAHAALRPSRGIVVKLAALFSLDSFAGGLAVQALLALWLLERFGLSLAEAGFFSGWACCRRSHSPSRPGSRGGSGW